jgi:hypothetical protein
MAESLCSKSWIPPVRSCTPKVFTKNISYNSFAIPPEYYYIYIRANNVVGQEEFRAMTDQYLVAGEGFILVFSVTEKKTLQRKSVNQFRYLF